MSNVSYSLHNADDMPEGLDTETRAALEAALITVFNATQAAVHVISGKLKASGRFSSSSNGEVWTGEIKYGGKEYGVGYAWYEQRRGGTHDFMDVAGHMDNVIGVAFREGLR